MRKIIVACIIFALFSTTCVCSAFAKDFPFGDYDHQGSDRNPCATNTDYDKATLTDTDHKYPDYEHKWDEDWFKDWEDNWKPDKDFDCGNPDVTPTRPQWTPVTRTDAPEKDNDRNIRDFIKYMKKFGDIKHIQIPVIDDEFEYTDFEIDEDGAFRFGFKRRGDHDKNKHFMHFDRHGRHDGTPTDVTATDSDAHKPRKFICMGDTNIDGNVSAGDALLVLQDSVDKIQITDEAEIIISDYDEDGALSAGDALAVLQTSVGKIQ